MLSYRHAFHAGNHADVLKHFIEVQLLVYLSQKEKPYWYIDTHAGAGCYQLDSGYAMQNAEFRSCIGRLWEREDIPPSLDQYVSLIKKFNPAGQLSLYPGSPMIAAELLRAQDKMRLFELHPTDGELLRNSFASYRSRILIEGEDGFTALKALLPPPTRRALILIDPPYEEKVDYQRVITALTEGLKRFANGVYAIWIPLLQRAEATALPTKLKVLPMKSWLYVELRVQQPGPDGFGMHGSGMFIINPPWTLQGELKSVMPYLVRMLGTDASAEFTLDYHEN
ncbi:MAG: 23S rRNA (adenine(2030)-N(6))-methyltransferase RlmJ [Gallionella sp.]